MKIITAVYSHPEFYPPTLNAIELLSPKVSEITILFRDVKPTEATYGANVKLVKSGKFKSIRATEVSSYFWKIKSFLKYTYTFYQLIRKINPKWVIVYDAIPLLAFSILSRFLIKKPKLWYHNHDVLEENTLNKYSISWLALKNEKKAFKAIDLFSLPSKERETFFRIDQLKGKYFFLPNYPLLKTSPKTPVNKVKGITKLLYQGHIGDGHGLIELIYYLKQLDNKSLSLSIIGYGEVKFKNQLIALIANLNLTDLVKVHEPLPYPLLRAFTLQHDVGLAIHLPKNLQNSTGATSSNKIYEYIACGLPVILYNIETYTKKLINYKWAFFTDLSNPSLDEIFSTILADYAYLSEQARNDFEDELNFEVVFNPIIQYLKL